MRFFFIPNNILSSHLNNITVKCTIECYPFTMYVYIRLTFFNAQKFNFVFYYGNIQSTFETKSFMIL